MIQTKKVPTSLAEFMGIDPVRATEMVEQFEKIVMDNSGSVINEFVLYEKMLAVATNDVEQAFAFFSIGKIQDSIKEAHQITRIGSSLVGFLESIQEITGEMTDDFLKEGKITPKSKWQQQLEEARKKNLK